MNYHPIMIAAHIQSPTAGATRRRKRTVWPWAVVAALSVAAMLAVVAGIAK